MFSLNEHGLRQLGATIGELPLSPDFADHVTFRVNADRDAQLSAILWSAAICHSTHGGLRGTIRSTNLSGWDYLLGAFMSAAESTPSMVAPDAVRRLGGDDLMQILTMFAEESAITLSDIDRRAEILRLCAEELIAAYGGSGVSALLNACNQRVSGAGGAYERLAHFTAFADELQKKSSAFLMTAYFAGLWTIVDLENVTPMIDYHRMRLLCRTGCIRVDDGELQDVLRQRRPIRPEVEMELRRVATIACRWLVANCQVGMFELDVLLWAHARSCCRNTPVCTGGAIENASFYQLVLKPFEGKCVFQAWCEGASRAQLRELWEPTIATELY